MKREKIIELHKVWKIYRTDHLKVEALRGVDLAIHRGEIVSIMGASGSGKSTLLHIIGLLDRPTTGHIKLNGMNINKLSDDKLAQLRGQFIGFVFQFFNLYPTLTAQQNIELPLTIQEYPSGEKKDISRELLDMVDLTEQQDQLSSQLSGGQRQRVAIARALATKPDLILADEPTGNLDSKSGKDILKILMKINKKTGTTVVIVTHDKNIASKAGRIIQIKDGAVILDKRRRKK